MITGQIKNQIKAAVKVNTEMFEFYWTMDREISKLHKSAKWGSAFFDCLSLDLKTEFPNQSGFSAANIRYSKRWYEFYNQGDIILQRISATNCYRICRRKSSPTWWRYATRLRACTLRAAYYCIWYIE